VRADPSAGRRSVLAIEPVRTGGDPALTHDAIAEIVTPKR
jgi:hypothetical protein